MSYGHYQQQGQYGQPLPPQGGAQGYYQQPPQGQYPPPQQGQYPLPQQGQYGYGASPPGPPPGQYGGHSPAPPYGQYPPPQQPYGQLPYGAPAPQEMFGSPAPPQNYQHNQPPHGQGYGQPPPPPQQQGGAYGYYQQQPPPGQYGAPPPQQQFGQPPFWGAAPPPPAQGPPTAPSLGYGAPQIINWDANPTTKDVYEALHPPARKAFRVGGTDERLLIKSLADKDPFQITAIREAYTRNYRRDLIQEIKDDTTGWFEKGLVAIARGPLMHDCFLLYEAMDGLGTKEKVLNDVLLGRSNADINAIKSAYRLTFRRDLVAAIKDDLSLKTERHFVIVLQAARAEDSAPVVKANIDADVEALYNATEGKAGTDEMKVCSILSTRNDNQIRAIAHEYQRKYARDLEKVIRKEFSGHMEDALLFQLGHAMDKYMHQATLLEAAMAGMGTKDHLLISRVVRCHWDRTNLSNVKGAYEKKYRTSLARRIKGETSGDYERLMLACIGEH